MAVLVICSWCGDDLGEAKHFSPRAVGVTHSICENCDETQRLKAIAEDEEEEKDNVRYQGKR